MKKTLWLSIALTLLITSPAHADGWFPRVNGRGEIASGAGTLTVKGQDRGTGWSPRWIDDDTVVYNGGTSSVILNVTTGARTEVQPAYNNYAAGGGSWMAFWAGNPITARRYAGANVVGEWTNAGQPLVSPNGRWGYVTPYHDINKTVYVNGSPVARGVIADVDLTDRSLVYTVASGRYAREVYYVRDGAAPQRVNVFNWEAPVGCEGPDATWILSVTQKGLAFRRAGATQGFYWRGEYFNPDCRFVNGVFRIVSSSGRGALQILDVRGTEGQVNYANITDDCVECDTTVAPPPVPDKKPGPVVFQFLAPNRQAVVADVIRAHPEVNACDEDSLTKGRALIVDWVAQRLNKAEGRVIWGRKSRGRPNGDRADNPNTDGLTYLRPDGRFEIYDAIAGTSPCGSTWDGFGPFAQGENGYWAPPQLGPEGGTAPTPTPPPAPPPTPTPSEDPRVKALEERVAGLERTLRDTDARLSGRLDALPPPTDEARIRALVAELFARAVVIGKTRVAIGHQHNFEVLGITIR